MGKEINFPMRPTKETWISSVSLIIMSNNLPPAGMVLDEFVTEVNGEVFYNIKEGAGELMTIKIDDTNSTYQTWRSKGGSNSYTWYYKGQERLFNKLSKK
jgi:hypothetical protein